MATSAILWQNRGAILEASSHREAPLIANDPLENTDLYAFRSPDDTNKVTIIANYVPFESPDGGPNYHSFGENVRYEIYIKNNATTTGDDITYWFTFQKANQDGTTFFNIRPGQQNLKTTYTLSKKVGKGTFTDIVSNGIVPPANIGPRSIEGAAGLNSICNTIMANAVATATKGEKVFAGPVDDPFFVDLGAIFDLGRFVLLPEQVRPRQEMGLRDLIATLWRFRSRLLLYKKMEKVPIKLPIFSILIS